MNVMRNKSSVFLAIMAPLALGVSCVGPDGMPGAEGAAGLQGSAGPEGPEGARGANGADGEPGLGLDLEIVPVDDSRLVYSPAIGCGADEWCEQEGGWSENGLAPDGRYTSCAGDADCSAASVVLELDDNAYKSVVLSHHDAPESGIILVELSFDGGLGYGFHKAVDTRRVVAKEPRTARQRVIASNLPQSVDVRVRLIAAKGRMNVEGFGLSQAILPEGEGQALRSLARASANGPNDTTCDVQGSCGPSPLATRRLTFVKVHDETDVRVQYIDTMRSYSSDGQSRACRWHVFFDGQPCPDGDVYGDVYIRGSSLDNAHRTRSVGGYCPGLPAGVYDIQVHVSNTPGYQAGCHTGWQDQRWLLEAEEIR